MHAEPSNTSTHITETIVESTAQTTTVPIEPTSPKMPMTEQVHVSESATTETSVTVPASTFNQFSGLWAQHLKEQTRARRWKYGFRFVLLTLFALAVLWPLLRGSSNTSATQKHVGLIKLEGTIEYGSPAGAEPMIAALQAAFEDSSSVAVVLQMNSPGGSPVQSSLIYDEINRLRIKYNKPIYAVVEELCASGCYYVAAAVDEIYVQPASLVGSIGVIMEGFGATELMKKLGVERRIYTAGNNKGMLDPFSPATDKQKSMVNAMLKDVHEQFITAVKDGRGESLVNDPEVFSGRVFTGSQSIKLGLADEIGSVSTLARDVIGVDNLVDYSPKENIAERVAKKLGASFGAGAMQSLLKASDAHSVK
jgi:protease IV